MSENLIRGGRGARGGARPNSGRPSNQKKKLKKTLEEKYAGEAEKSLRACIRLRDNPDSPASVVLAAASEIMDRIIGKPKQAIHHSGSIDMDAESAMNQIKAGVSEFLSSVKVGIV